VDAFLLVVAGAVALAVSASFALAWAVRGVRQEIVNALSSAESESDKAEIERKVLKAVYPPRFNRD
jgi:beta-lactam-binding protein with PASTA domain